MPAGAERKQKERSKFRRPANDFSLPGALHCGCDAARRGAARRDADAMRRIAVSSLGAENAVSKTVDGNAIGSASGTEGETSGVNGTVDRRTGNANKDRQCPNDLSRSISIFARNFRSRFIVASFLTFTSYLAA